MLRITKETAYGIRAIMEAGAISPFNMGGSVLYLDDAIEVEADSRAWYVSSKHRSWENCSKNTVDLRPYGLRIDQARVIGEVLVFIDDAGGGGWAPVTRYEFPRSCRHYLGIYLERVRVKQIRAMGIGRLSVERVFLSRADADPEACYTVAALEQALDDFYLEYKLAEDLLDPMLPDYGHTCRYGRPPEELQERLSDKEAEDVC